MFLIVVMINSYILIFLTMLLDILSMFSNQLIIFVDDIVLLVRQNIMNTK